MRWSLEAFTTTFKSRDAHTHLDAKARALRLIADENGVARFSLSEAISMDGRGNVDLRDPEHTNGDRFSCDSEVDH